MPLTLDSAPRGVATTLLLLTLLSGASAQQTVSPLLAMAVGSPISTSSTMPATMTSTPPTQASASQPTFPACSDDAPGCSGSSPTSSSSSQQQDSSRSLVNYYFVFIAVIVAFLAVILWLFWRRRKMQRSRARDSREDALARDVTEWAPGRGRRRWVNGHWGDAAESREEGLNEAGEAPPPYMPKRETEAAMEEGGDAEPAIPLRVLSREDAALKPPDYTEMSVTTIDTPSRTTSSGSRAGPGEPSVPRQPVV